MDGFKLFIKRDEEDGEAAEVLVDGFLENHPYRFLLDTGAAKSSVLHDDYTAQLNPVGQGETSRSVFGEDVPTLVSVPRLELGSVVKENFTLARAAKGSPAAHNLIGMDVLKDFCCHFRFDKGEVLIGPAEENPDQALFLDDRSHPYVDVHFGEVSAKAVWDTGAGITAAHTGFIEAHPNLFERVGHLSGTDGSGISVKTPVFRMADARIGGRAFSPHKVVGIDLSWANETLEVPMDLLLGYSTLGQANWLFDFPAKRWAVTKLLDG